MLRGYNENLIIKSEFRYNLDSLCIKRFCYCIHCELQQYNQKKEVIDTNTVGHRRECVHFLFKKYRQVSVDVLYKELVCIYGI